MPNRQERLIEFSKEIKKVFKNDTYYIIDGVVEKPISSGIAQAHMNAIKIALDMNWEYVIVMEDDLLFQANSETTLKYIKEAFKNVPDDFDMLLGGIYQSKGLMHYNEFWQQTKEFAALHFYIVPRKNYEKFLSFNKNGHIDRWCARDGFKKCYVTKKLFAIQKNGYSDNAEKEVNYDYMLNKFTLLK